MLRLAGEIMPCSDAQQHAPACKPPLQACHPRALAPKTSGCYERSDHRRKNIVIAAGEATLPGSHINRRQDLRHPQNEFLQWVTRGKSAHRCNQAFADIDAPQSPVTAIARLASAADCWRLFADALGRLLFPTFHQNGFSINGLGSGAELRHRAERCRAGFVASVRFRAVSASAT